MLAGPKRAVSGPNQPPRSDRVITDYWRGLYGSDPFSSMLRRAASEALRNGAICAKISSFAGFRLAGDGSSPGAYPVPNRQTLSNC